MRTEVISTSSEYEAACKQGLHNNIPVLTANVYPRAHKNGSRLSCKPIITPHTMQADSQPNRLWKWEPQHNTPRVTSKRHRSTGTESSYRMHQECTNFQFHPAKNQRTATSHPLQEWKTASSSCSQSPPNRSNSTT